MIEAVIFDLDGTLIELPMDYEKLFSAIRRILKTENIAPLLKTVANTNEKDKKEIFNAWDKIELDALPKIGLKKEGINIYNKFPEKPKILVTMQGRKFALAALKHLSFSFHSVITREDSLDRTNQLLTALRELGLLPQNVLFVGNEDHDERASKEVGCQFLRVK